MPPTFLLEGTPIYLGHFAEAFPPWLEKQGYSSVFVLCDENTLQHVPKNQPPGTVIPAGEKFKNLRSCESIWEAMLNANLDRKALVLNLGGGVIGDMGGFCAATWKRGVDFVQVPTTLLAMTDAAIGGKTGIDFHGFKNNIGVFRQPAATFVDPSFLQTLPQRELLSGFAEIIKHALIGSSELYQQLRTLTGNGISHPLLPWHDMLQKSIAVKVRIVQEDPYEKGLRMLLNFGHTVGHALESWFLNTDNALTHGEAVYIGMVCESEMAHPEGQLRTRVLDLGQYIFPHRSIPKKSFAAIWELMQQDKKNSSGTVRLAVPDEFPFSLKLVETNPIALERALNRYNALGQAH